MIAQDSVAVAQAVCSIHANGWDVLLALGKAWTELLAPTLTLVAAGLGAYFLAKLKGGQTAIKDAAIDAAAQAKITADASERRGVKLDEVHTLVNGEKAELKLEVNKLRAALATAGVPVPPELGS